MPIPRPAPWLDVIHILALSVWLAGLLSAGLSAAIIFPQMKSLHPALPDFAHYSGEHWKIAGGFVANRIFLIVDSVQLVCASTAILTLGLTLLRANKAPVGSPARRPPLAGTRILLLTFACALLAYELLILSPRMALNLNNFWTAAKDGNRAVADAAQAAFDADHPIASNVLVATAAAVLLLLVSAAIGLAARKDANHA